MASLQFKRIEKIVEVLSPDVTIGIQELLNKCQAQLAEPDYLDVKEFVSAGGKEPLPDNVKVGITLSMYDGWRVRFEDRPGPSTIQMNVSGGNLVGFSLSIDEPDLVALEASSQSPIAPSTFTQVVLTASSSATLILNDNTVDQAGADLVVETLMDWDLSVGPDTGSPSRRTVRQAFRALRNRIFRDIANSLIRVYREDDTTEDWQATEVTDNDADQLIGYNPQD
jgi:hypothetical protein